MTPFGGIAIGVAITALIVYSHIGKAQAAIDYLKNKNTSTD